MRRASSALVLVALLVPASADADTFSFTRSDKLVEKAHTVDITLKRDHAVIEVERTVHNGGERPDQALFHIHNDAQLVATGLRTQAIVEGKPVWFEGELMEAEAAATKYRELTGIGGYYPKDPALLSWRSAGHLALQVFPCMPKEDKKVAYTFVAPMRYEQGKYVLDIGRMGTEEVVPKGTARAASGTMKLDGKDVPASFELDEMVRFEQTVSFSGPLGGRLASVPFAKDKALAGFHFDVSPRLADVPDKARIVILVDQSKSVHDGDRAASLAVASAYLDHFDGSDVKASVLGFHRTVEPLTKGFADVATAQEAMAEAKLTGKNGSEVGRALARASELLATAPEGTARRVVLFTDLRTKLALTPEVARRALPPHAVLHVVTATASGPSLQRDDEDAWAVLPRASGGVLWQAGASDEADANAEMRTVFEELARPLRLDHVSVRAPGLEEKIEALSLSEGEGIERHVIADRAMTFVSFKAELWSKPVIKTLEPDVDYGRLRAALVFGTDLGAELDDREMMTLAMYGRAVSPVTSYLAIEPGVRPSTEGLEDGEGGGGRGEGIGLGSVGTIGHGSGSGSAPDFEALLKEALDGAKQSCGVSAATVTVESTLDEVVEVSSKVEDREKQSEKRTCLVEAAWRLTLPVEFGSVIHRTTTARL